MSVGNMSSTRNMRKPQVRTVTSRGRFAQSVAHAGIVLYVHLWILEGAARKWIPVLSEPMYVARDALLALVLVTWIITGSEKRRAFVPMVAILGISIFCCVQIIAVSEAPVVIAAGLRSYIAPILVVPLFTAFASALLLDRVIRALRFWAVPTLIIVFAQVLSPTTSPINWQVGTEAAYFVNDGVVRASGTFSSPSGLALYIALALACCLSQLQGPVRADGRNPVLVYVAVTLSLLVCTALSGSRGLVLATVLILATASIRAVKDLKPSSVKTIFWIICSITGLVALLWSLLPDVVNSFLTRFENAAQSENSFARILDQTVGFVDVPLTFWGHGAGAHSQVGISLGSGYQWAEIENEKWVLELGFIGLAFACLKLLLATAMAFVSLSRRTPVLSTALMAALWPVLAFGQITQTPSSQGFVGIALGLLVATGTLKVNRVSVGDGKLK